MIAQLTGTVVRVEANSVVLDVGGVGYQLFVPVPVLSGLPEAGAKTTLSTCLLLRGQPEMEMTLYGFSEVSALQAFKLLIGTTGVGPKVALAMLSTFEVEELARALSSSDTRSLTRVPGVGPKLAQRLCLELGDRMATFAFEQTVQRAEGGGRTEAENAAHEDVVEALVGLGYSRAEARRAAGLAIANASDKAHAASLITSALNILTSGRR